MLSTPSLACMTAFAHMSEQEMECCKHMAGDCSSMQNLDHGCCKTSSVSSANQVMHMTAVSQRAPILAVAEVRVVFLAGNIQATQSSISLQSHSPPRPRAAPIVLRI